MKKIHLMAPAGNLRSFYQHLGVENGAAMLSLFQKYAGNDFKLTADLRILDAAENEMTGGRRDDDDRAADFTYALGDPDVTAIVGIRGGAWFTRILPKIRFGVLDQRTSPITVFGFSELTPFINIVAHHPMGRAYHDMGPAFLVYGLKRAFAQAKSATEGAHLSAEEWMRENLHRYVAEYFQTTIKILKGQADSTVLLAERVRGKSLGGCPATFVGGNLTVLSTIIGTFFGHCLEAKNRWLVLEDFNDKPERFDRFFSHLTLAGLWGLCEGLLLGDFHYRETDLREAILAMLEYHIADLDLPVLATRQVGHTWPMTPLPLHEPGVWRQTTGRVFEWRPGLAV